MKKLIRLSIKRQLFIAVLTPLIVLCAFTAVCAYFLAVGFANDAYDRDLINSADSVAARLHLKDGKIWVDLPPAAQAILRHNNRDKFYYQIIGPTGQRLSGDANLPGPFPNLEDDKPVLRSARLNGEDVRIARIRVELANFIDRPMLVQVAETLHSRSELAQQILLSIMVPQIVLTLLGAYAVSRGITYGLRPLAALTAAIGSRTQADLRPVAEDEAPEEVLPLIVAINDLLARLTNDIEAQKRFVSNSAHQFRTPLAALKTYIYFAKKLPADREMNTTLDRIDESTQRMTGLSNKLLALAKAEPNSRTIEMGPIDLNFIASDAVSMMVAQAHLRKQSLDFIGASEEAVIVGNAHNLGELTTNLIENAIFYTPNQAKILVRVIAGADVTLSVEDDGPGIPEAERKLVFERFYRVLGSQHPGSGLGLAIVKEISQAHKARISIDAGPGGKGTAVRVVFARSDKS